MGLLSHYFPLPEGKVLANGAKYSVILDLQSGKAYRVSAFAGRIIELGEQGLRIVEAIEKLGPKHEASDVLSFLRELVSQGLIVLSTDPKPPSSEKWPLPKLHFLWIEVTPRCNLHCVHCYAEAESKRAEQSTGLSREQLKGVIDEAAELDCRKIQFTGGEPALRDDLRELVEHAKARGLEAIEIFTNGTLLMEPMIQFFAEEGIHVAISVYSHRAETHDKITGVPGSFERTLNSLKSLVAHGVPTRCVVVAMKLNEDELDATGDFLSQLGVTCGPPDPVRPSGRGTDMENWPQKHGLRFIRTQPDFQVNLETYERNRRWNSCWFGKAAITSQGDVLPCVFARDHVAGNVEEQSLTEIIQGERMLGFWGLNKDKVEVCVDCEYRYICEDCRPWAYGLTGNLHAKTPRCAYDPYTGEWAKVGEALSLAGCVGKPMKHK